MDPICRIPPDTIVHDDEIRIMSRPVSVYHFPRVIWSRIWAADPGRGERVAILDTGYTAHELLPRPVAMRSFVPRETIRDGNGHGNHVTGSAVGLDGIGAAPCAEWIAAKVLADNGSGQMQWSAQAIHWAISEGATIINMSLGSDRPDRSLDEAVRAADDAGVIVVAAAGNSGFAPGRNTIGYPARYLWTACTGALDSQRRPTSFSSGGREMDAAAYGERIVSASHRGNQLTTMSGTSMASPILAGTLAALQSMRTRLGMQRFPNLADLRVWLEKNAIELGPPGRDEQTGWGKIDSQRIAEKMVDELTWI